MKKPNHILIFDTTLRDGEQCPGASMGLHEKLQVARQLEKLNVDIIEAGFPAASPGDFEAVKKVATEIKKCRIAGLARCVKKDIDACVEALKPAGDRARIHVFLATSAIHREFKLKKAKDEIIRQAVEGVAYAKQFCQDIQFSPEDASRTEPAFLAEVVRAAIAAGATTINIPDTVGFTMPQEFRALLTTLHEQVPELKDVVVHVHCHDDLGLAVANSLAAIECGARGVECTINGIGERAGNCSLEEVVMALKVRGDLYGIQTRVKTQELFAASRLVSQLTGMMVQRNKAIVGANAFAHESGIHQDGMLKHRETYEIMRPEDVGVVTGTDLVLGKHSGRAGFSAHLKNMGIKVNPEQLQGIYNAFIVLADKKKVVYDDDIIELLREFISDVPRVYAIKRLQVSAGNQTIPTATVQVEKDGKMTQDSATGAGPVEAALKAIERLTDIKGELKSFAMQAVTHGEDALGEASVQVRFGTELVAAKGSDIDIVMASAKAYINALNRYLFIEEKGRTSP
ncbi:MAG: 2-isopropylmalate synthase [Kiritimatiellae bacterium]|jgi:2-isopropylmalate synthase|nr:2-isopropylmalate synthase [Kiritimatiellia bacterium]MDD4341036.1 2-isopropylmalate synthase [Kiritimatiellia bacterium]MDY0149595.1 2-isopropylmalate synthase [Kiritimatiellia bacterium]